MQERVHTRAQTLRESLLKGGVKISDGSFFDTLTILEVDSAALCGKAAVQGLNFRLIDEHSVGISVDETTCLDDLKKLAEVFGSELCGNEITENAWQKKLSRRTDFLKASAFRSYHSETEMLRYIKRLESKDLALNESMIALGSCTMKLNGTSEMLPLSWPEVSEIHPFAPRSQSEGYRKMLQQLELWLAEITGFAAVSLQPNAGAQGEYAGLLAIRRFHESKGEGHRKICLIPVSAHGTNPASAVMCGMQVIGIRCDERGNIDMKDLNSLVDQHRHNLAALMVTYPSTHGVFEETIREITATIHEAGGQVYMDGANMNAQVGLTSPGLIGADVCHLNLHKTFCIPHGGGGPGVGPIGVASHLVDYLPGHELLDTKKDPVCSAPYGSASINTISWMYIAMMGADGLRKATEVAILNANYIAKRLAGSFPVLYTGKTGLVAHECIIDCRPIAQETGITVEDIAKRLMDYGFHAPTMSWPVTGTLMIEPTESEAMPELDRFCDAMISIYKEVEEVRDGTMDPVDNVLKNAPHTSMVLCKDEWAHSYGREKAAFPLSYLREHKFWPAVGRVDNVHGDRNLVCTCDSVEAYAAAEV